MPKYLQQHVGGVTLAQIGLTLRSRQSVPTRSRTWVELETTTMRSPIGRSRSSMHASTASFPDIRCHPACMPA